MEPVRGGKLAKLTDDAEKLLREARPEASDASWAFNFVKGLPNVQVILSGMNDPAQVTDNLKTFSTDEALTPSETETLMKAADVFRSQIIVPCTGCRYCTEGCPMKINIPEYLKLYNEYKLQGDWALNGAGSINSEGTPAQCIGCGSCRALCPQSINIPYYMEQLAKLIK